VLVNVAYSVTDLLAGRAAEAEYAASNAAYALTRRQHFWREMTSREPARDQGSQMTPWKFSWGSNIVFWPPYFWERNIFWHTAKSLKLLTAF